MRRSQEVLCSLASDPIGRGEEPGELPDFVRQITHLMNDNIGSKVFDRRDERLLVEEVAQDRSRASDAESVNFLWSPRHGRNDMSLGDHERHKRAPITPVALAKKIRIPLLALLSDYIASPRAIAEKKLRVNQAKVEWHPGELYPLGVSLDPLHDTEF